MVKYLIVGGVAGGMSAAARLRRLDEKAEIIVFEKGLFVSYANCGLPYYISGVISDEKELTLQTPESFNRRFRVDVRVENEVLSIDRKAKKITVKNLKNGKEYSESYDKLILSPGANPIRPGIPGIDSKKIFTLRTIPDTLAIKQFILKERPRSAAIIGAGYISLEMAENLNIAGLQVTIIEAMPQILNIFDMEMASIVEKSLKQQNINILTNKRALAFHETGNSLELELSDNTKINTDMIILSIGVNPEISLAKTAGLECKKGISVNDYLQTSDPDIYAIGDAIEVLNPVLNKKMVIPLAGPANKQGRMAADNIVSGNKKIYKGTFGASVLKIFDLTAASVGTSSQALDTNGILNESVITHLGNHAGYYPGAGTISLKLIFSPDNGKILGAQAIGAAMTEKKIDVISAIMMKNGTIFDLMEFEQSYAPPYSSAKDIVNMAGFAAENVLEGMVKPLSWLKYRESPESFILLDVRTQDEFARGSTPGAVNIPVDELRQRLKEIPIGKKLAIYCGVGIRSYIASRILKQNGFNEVYNLSGGYYTYSTLNK